MIILGIDPGTTAIGYGVLECTPHGTDLIDAGLIKITQQTTQDRLHELHSGVKQIIESWQPTAIGLERLFFAKNAKTALAVAEARGVILLTTALAGVTVYEYTPLEVKKFVTGDGRADKAQVEKIVNLTVKKATSLKARDDVYDAIAIALTCYLKEGRTLKVED